MSYEGHGNDINKADTSSERVAGECIHPTTSTNHPIMSILSSSIADQLLRLELDLCTQLNSLRFSAPVEYVYSPIEYAFNLHAQYVRKFCNSSKKVLFLGMNPGPWGMCQTGVPFGEVTMVKEWLRLEGSVNRPTKEHPKRQVCGLDCHRSEISGKKFWGLFQELCGSNPHVFFDHCFLYNQCPISLMSGTGKNITPAELKASESKQLLAICDSALAAVLLLLQVQLVVAIGKFAEKRAYIVSKGKQVKVVSIPHPSPRNASFRHNWKETVTGILENQGILAFFSGS